MIWKSCVAKHATSWVRVVCPPWSWTPWALCGRTGPTPTEEDTCSFIIVSLVRRHLQQATFTNKTESKVNGKYSSAASDKNVRSTSGNQAASPLPPSPTPSKSNKKRPDRTNDVATGHWTTNWFSVSEASKAQASFFPWTSLTQLFRDV